MYVWDGVGILEGEEPRGWAWVLQGKSVQHLGLCYPI